MNQMLKQLYWQEIDEARLNFEADPAYQTYFTQSQVLWEGANMPEPLFRLLETSNYLSFAHGFRLGLGLRVWAEGPCGAPRAAEDIRPDEEPVDPAPVCSGGGPKAAFTQ